MKVDGETSLRGYAFAYDNLSRLTSANYLINGSVNDYYKVPKIEYDKHGNILKLERRGKTTAGSTYASVDNLAMTYAGNQLTRVDDSGTSVSIPESSDFKNYSNVATEYTYNRNGALAKDLNKGITEIKYNSLNLPQQMDIKSPVTEGRNEYLHSVGRTKLQVTQQWNPNYQTNPIIGTAIDESTLDSIEVTDHVGMGS